MFYGDRIQRTSASEAVLRVARRDESLGMATVWCSEAARDPYLPLAIAASGTRAVALGTGVAIAYARSPYATAQSAWSMQELSGGRFRLGVATQVRAHIERRYGMPWPGGVDALRDYLQCCLAIWDSWQHGTRPEYEGEHYRFTLSNPEFRPEPLPDDSWRIPLWIAAVGPRTAALAGELGTGIHVHAFHTPGYLEDVVVAAAREGRARAGRTDAVEATCPIFAGIAHDEAEARALRDGFRGHLAFYASTPAYLPVLEHAGLGDLHEPLRRLAREGRWDDMAEIVDDEVVDVFAVVDEPVALARRVRERYASTLTEVGLYRGGDRFASDDELGVFVEALKSPIL